MWLCHTVVCLKEADRMANRVDPDQTATLGAVWSGSTLYTQTPRFSMNRRQYFYQTPLFGMLGNMGLYKLHLVITLRCTVFKTCQKLVNISGISVKCKLLPFDSDVIIWATSWQNLLLPYANNKGADQPAHLCSLISVFVVRCLDRIIPLVSTSEISSL